MLVCRPTCLWYGTKFNQLVDFFLQYVLVHIYFHNIVGPVSWLGDVKWRVTLSSACDRMNRSPHFLFGWVINPLLDRFLHSLKPPIFPVQDSDIIVTEFVTVRVP